MLNHKFTLTRILFVLYGAFILWAVLFKTTFSFADIAGLVRPRSLNLIPFYYECDVSIRFHIEEVLLNVLLFFPFGVYLKLLNLPSRRSILTGFLFSLTLELCQFAFALGTCDITDLITNTAGTAVGVCLYLLLVKLFKNQTAVNQFLRISALTATILLGILILLLYLGIA